MENLNERAANYAAEKANELLANAIAQAYADGYCDGYKDREEEIPVDLLNEKKEFIDNKIKEYNNVFDVALVGNCDYEPIIEILKKII